MDHYNTARAGKNATRDRRIYRSTSIRKAMRATQLAVLIFVIFFLVVTPTVSAADKPVHDVVPVRLQLKWRHQFVRRLYTRWRKAITERPVSP